MTRAPTDAEVSDDGEDEPNSFSCDFKLPGPPPMTHEQMGTLPWNKGTHPLLWTPTRVATAREVLTEEHERAHRVADWRNRRDRAMARLYTALAEIKAAADSLAELQGKDTPP